MQRSSALQAFVPLAAALALGLTPQSAALAIPRLDLSAYPAPTAGLKRWVIQLPGVLPPGPIGQVQLLVGREMQVDCNLHQLSGRLQPSQLPGSGLTLYRLEPLGPKGSSGVVISTRRACPGQPLQQRFVTLAGPPLLLPYRVSRPIVVDLPEGLELRWQLWQPSGSPRQALQIEAR